MGNIDRLREYRDIGFDRLIRDISTGKVKCGKHAKLVKVTSKGIKIDKEEFKSKKEEGW